MRIQNISGEHMRELLRFIRDVGLAVGGILAAVGGSIWVWTYFEVWGVVTALALALIVCVVFYWRRKIRSVPYLKEGKEAQIEVIKLLEATSESLYYYGGVGFISDAPEWHDEYKKKLESATTISRFLNTKRLNEVEEMLKDVMPPKDVKEAIEAYSKWLTTHCENLQKRVQHNCFYHFEGAPIWRYGLHCIIFDEKHVVLPFASGETRNAVFIRNCPKIARALTRCLDGLTKDFKLESLSSGKLAELAGLPQTSGGKE